MFNTMKKEFILTLIVVFLFAGPVSARMLYEYGSFEERAEVAYSVGLVESPEAYTGDYETNLRLLEVYEGRTQAIGGAGDPFQPTFAPVSIRQSLVSGASRSGTTLNTDPMITPDGFRVTFASFNSDYMYFKIDQGKSNEEIIRCEGITDNTTYYTLTGCTWGCQFYSGTCDVDANKKRHVSGAKIGLYTDWQFINYNYVSLDTAQTIEAVKTFSVSPIVPAPTTDSQAATKLYADNIANQGAATSTQTVAGIGELATQSEMASSYYDVTDPKLLDTRYASSTPNVDQITIPVTESDGYLNQGFLDLTDDYSWDGNHSISGNQTISGEQVVSGTSTISGKMIYTGFGGTASDGALNITTGTTTIDADSNNVVIKNYSSINISSGAGLEISNKATNGTILILKSQGDCTIAGQIWLVGDGANGKTNGYGLLDNDNHYGGDGNVGEDGAEAVGTAGPILTNKYFYVTPDANILYRKMMTVMVGNGGGAGGKGENASNAGGIGGAGGGALIIECGGYLNFSGIINVSGGIGGSSTFEEGDASAGGGGGGSAGMALVLYNGLTANTGTIIASGGAGGDSADGDQTNDPGVYGGTGGGGGGGYSYAGAAGGDNAADANCTNGGDGDAGVGGGGAGGSGRQGIGGTNSGCTGGAGGASDTNHYLVTENIYF
jgi:hypothetical protein